jgi:hypothetical protein
LLLSNSHGYVNDDGAGMIDIESEIKQEEAFISIIMNKIQMVNPDVIFVEKDVSR